MEPIDHLFRRESGRMVAVLTGLFGVHNFALAEDAVQDAFCRAIEVWKFKGVPDNPSAWLMAIAKNRALDVLRRQRAARTFGPEFGRLLQSEWTLAQVVEAQFSETAIKDGVLRMMFSCCQPLLPEEAQVGLILHILCGFSVEKWPVLSFRLTQGWRSELRGRKKLSRNRNASSTSPKPRNLLSACWRCITRCIYFSTKAITELRRILR